MTFRELVNIISRRVFRDRAVYVKMDNSNLLYPVQTVHIEPPEKGHGIYIIVSSKPYADVTGKKIQ